jgi:hypothetical protein
LRPLNFELLDWILRLAPTCRYNFTSSGLYEPDLSAMGINTSFEEFAGQKKTDAEHATVFAESVAKLYGVEADNVVLTSGASEAIFLVYSVFGRKRRGRAFVPVPNYEPMFAVPASLDMTVVRRYPRGASELVVAAGGGIVGVTDPTTRPERALMRGPSASCSPPAERGELRPS